MINPISLSDLTQEIQNTFDERFAGQAFWITAEISDVKKQALAKRCYLKFIERIGSNTLAELRAVFWSNSYAQIEEFEKATKQNFVSGLKIICLVKVRYHQIYGLNADVLQIDIAHTVGTIELERQATLERLVKENPTSIRLIGEQYITSNNTLPLPIVVKSIALITASNSDGQRDFIKEMNHNKYGYAFSIQEFLCTIQGENAHQLIIEQLKLIEQSKVHFDVVAIVRGGGSQTDFAPFEKYELAKMVALFPIPIFTGIGHDSNTSIVDLMARSYKTPTKVASQLIEYNFEFENQILKLKERFDLSVENMLEEAKQNIAEMKRLVKMASPEATLKRGFAILWKNNEMLINADKISVGDEISITMSNAKMKSKILNKVNNEKGTNI